MVGDKLAVRASQVCTPGGLKACPLGTFEILDAFYCNLVHILPKKSHLSPFVYLYSVDERGGGRAPPTPPGSAPDGAVWRGRRRLRRRRRIKNISGGEKVKEKKKKEKGGEVAKRHKR